MIEEELAKIKRRNNFYRNAFRSMVGALVFMLLVCIVLIMILGYLIINTQKPAYYATSNDGKLVQLTALSTPAMTRADLLDWAARIAVETYNYNYVNYRRQLEVLRPNFTASGYNAFVKSLRLTGTLDKVIDEKLRSMAVATGVAVILEHGIIGGKYAWKVELPVLVTYESASGATERRSLIVTMIISRVSTLDAVKGIAVAQFFSRTAEVAPQ